MSFLEKSYSRETKVIGAVHPRSSSDAVLYPAGDRLMLVYDVFRNAQCEKLVPQVNLLFLHGSGMNRSIWEYYLAKFAKSNPGWAVNKAVLLDQVNHGDSALLNKDKLGINYDWSDGARDACKVAMAEFGSEEDGKCVNILLGHSMGGFQALACGVLMPGLFQQIIVIEPVLVALNISNKGDNTVVPPSFYASLLPKTRDTFQNREEYNQFMKSTGFFKNAHPDILKRLKETDTYHTSTGLVKSKMEGKQHLLCYLTLYPAGIWLLRSLESIKTPVVSIWGQESHWCPPENAQTLAERIPNYTSDIIPKADHLLNIEAPDQVISCIICHISRFMQLNGNLQPQKVPSCAERHTAYDQMFTQFQRQRVRQGKPQVVKL